MASMTGAQALIKALAQEGVEVIFGLPGVQIMSVFDALYDQPTIRLITARHEQAAAYMADGYARTTGKIGVALVVPGPGALNAAAALATAYSASSPVLLISGQVERHNLGKDQGVLHEINDQLEIFRPITKWCHRAMTAGEIPQAIHLAFEQLRTGRPRPVELEIPWDVLTSDCTAGLENPKSASTQAINEDNIAIATDLLEHASFPLIWVGGGVIASGGSKDLLELATTLHAPVITTPEGKGSIPEEHPHSVGVYYYGHGPSQLAIPKADVILAVGTRFHISPKPSWAIQDHQKLIHIDIDPAELGRNYPTEVSIASDAQLALQALASRLKDKHTSSCWTKAHIASIKQSAANHVQTLAPLQHAIIKTLRNQLADDAIVVSGITNIGYWSHLAFPVRQPRSYVTSSYFATLGFAFPTAIGCKIGNPNKQVIAICGDGGFMYAVQELSTAVQENANIVVLVFRDDAFGASFTDQRRNYKQRIIGTQINNPSFSHLAELFGATGIKLKGPEDLADTLNYALNINKPVLIEVPIPSLPAPFQISPDNENIM